MDLANNKFISKLYSEKDFIGCDLGYIKLDASDQCEFSLHIKVEPKISVKKWGRWGIDFDVVVLKFISQGNSSVKANVCGEWNLMLESMDFDGEICNVKFSKVDSFLELGFNSIEYQESAVYIK